MRERKDKNTGKEIINNSSENIKYKTVLNELSGLYQISKAAEDSNRPLDEIIKDIVEIIDKIIFHDSDSEVKIEFYDEVFTTSNYKDGDNKVESSLKAFNNVIGKISIVLSDPLMKNKRDDANERTYFLKEDKRIIEILGERIGKIIERKKVEEELRLSEEKYREFIEHSPNIVYQYSNKRGAIFWSNRVKEILGFEPEELIKNPFMWNDSIHPEDKPIVEEAIADYNKGLEYNINYRIKKKSGEWIWLNDFFMNKKVNEDEIIIEGQAREITKEVEAQEALKVSEERLKLALTATRDGVWEWNLETNELYLSPSWKNLLGYEENELKNEYETFKKLIVQEDYEKTLKIFNDHVANNTERYNAEFRMYHKDGSIKYILARAHAYYDETGKAIKAVGTHQDITENKKLQKALEESEARWQYAVEGNSDGLWDWNLATNEVFFSPMWIEMLGYDKDEIKGSLEEWDKRIYPEDKEKVYKDVNNHIEGKTKFYRNEHRVLCKDGSYKWILDRGKITEYSEEGKPLRMIGTHSDITDRIRLSQEAEKGYKLLNELVKQVPGVLYQYQYYPDGRNFFPFSSDHIWDIYEVTPEEVKDDAAKVLSRLHPEDSESVIEKIVHSFNTLEVWSDDYRVILPSKGIRWLRGVANPEKLEDGSVLWHGYIIDITERKETERKLLETERLSAIGEMAGGIAHDLNNALQSIIGNIEIASYKSGNEAPIRKYLEAMRKAAEDSSERVKSLQRFSGFIESKDDHQTIYLHEIVNDVVEQIRPLWKSNAEKSGIKYKIEKKITNKIKLNVSISEIRSVFYNLIKNGLEAMPDGGFIKINSKLKNNMAAVYIEDAGIGMDENTVKRIFQPYFSTKGVDYNRGLGLSNVFGIVKEHNGEISVIRSEPGNGTTIELLLPIDEVVNEEEGIIIEDEKGRRKRILWVDDDIKVLDIVEEMFNFYEIDGKVSFNPKEALEEIEEDKYDLVITDIGMPGMNGWELAERIKEKTKGKQKVAVVTGWGDQLSSDLKEKHNVIKIITKPFSIAGIKMFIDEV